MMIDVTCPQCGEVYHADAVHVGKRIRCTKCSSLLPIGAGGTLAQKPPEANGSPTFQPPPSEARSARSSPRRAAFGLGSIVLLVVIITVGLVILLWYAGPDEGTRSALHTGASVSRTSSETGGATTSVNSNSLPVVGQQPLTTGSDGLPCEEQALRSLMANGSRIVPDVGTSGHGVLEVQNGTNEDAVLSLYDSATDETIREVYVQARHSIRIKRIPVGTYQLVYTAGLDWDGSAAIFRCDPDYAQFERDFAFTEERDQEGVQYHSITVTLHPVVGGNVRTKKISRQEFLKNHRRTASLPR